MLLIYTSLGMLCSSDPKKEKTFFCFGNLGLNFGVFGGQISRDCTVENKDGGGSRRYKQSNKLEFTDRKNSERQVRMPVADADDEHGHRRRRLQGDRRQQICAAGKQENGGSVHQCLDKERIGEKILHFECESLFGGVWNNGIFGEQRVGFGEYVD